MNAEQKYLDEIALRLGAESEGLFLTWKGRVALYAILEAMEIGEGDEVILPAFTCVVVPNAILYRGAIPIYVDIEKETLNASYESIVASVSENTKAIICQNTFGLSSDLDRIADFARKKGIYTIEDCTHGFGGTFHGEPNGSFCDAAFYSTQWNKPFSTGIGGIGWVRNDDVQKRLNVSSYADPSWKSRTSLSLLLFVRKNMLRGWNYWPAVKLYRWLSKNNLVLGSSSGSEISDVQKPNGYELRSSQVQYKAGVQALEGLEAVLKRRKQNAMLLTRALADLGKYHVSEELHADHAFLKYPILVKDKSKIESLAVQNRLELGDWFNSQLHPVQSDLIRWGINAEMYPISKQIATHILNIPCDTVNVDRYVRFLEQFNEELI
ncbi:MAG: hypothetical protein CL833_13600 [Crocinitomicaceae bacterium]|nr:hypothetical protein [Crocinitomicaceae bacterium]